MTDLTRTKPIGSSDNLEIDKSTRYKNKYHLALENGEVPKKIVLSLCTMIRLRTKAEARLDSHPKLEPGMLASAPSRKSLMRKHL